MPDSNIVKLQKETYLKMIKNSIGSKLFNSIIVKFKDTGKTQDVCRNGQLSCAAFVSSVLFLNNYIHSPHATVKSTAEDLVESNWKRVSQDNLKLGDVIIWEKVYFENGQANQHIGFALNKNQAVSTSWKEGTVVRHHITFGRIKNKPKRAIIGAYRYKK